MPDIPRPIPPAAPATVRETPAEGQRRLDAWWREYERDLDRKIREEASARALRAIRERTAADRRREERHTVALTNLSVASYRQTRRFMALAVRLGRDVTLPGMPVSLAHRYHRIHVEQDGPLLEPFHSAFCAAARARGVEVRWTVTPGVNAYAWQRLRTIEVQPIRSELPRAPRGTSSHTRSVRAPTGGPIVDCRAAAVCDASSQRGGGRCFTPSPPSRAGCRRSYDRPCPPIARTRRPASRSKWIGCVRERAFAAQLERLTRTADGSRRSQR